jgi:SnoaL-like domain
MADLTLEQRIARLEAHNDICKLMAEYLLVADRGYDPDQIVAMFVENSTWEGDDFGRHEGRQAIWTFFRGLSGSLVFAAHFVTNPIITFESDARARGAWRLFEPATVNAGGALESSILVAAYDNSFVKVDGTWKFESVNVHVNFFEPISKGWAHAAKS